MLLKCTYAELGGTLWLPRPDVWCKPCVVLRLMCWTICILETFYVIIELLLDTIILASSDAARNLLMFDQELSFNSHIKQTSRTLFLYLCRISKSRTSSLEKSQFVTSSQVYFNSLLSDFPNQSLKTLQLIQNAAAHALTKTRDHISPWLASLNWFLVKTGIKSNSSHKGLNSQAASDLKERIGSYPQQALYTQTQDYVCPSPQSKRGVYTCCASVSVLLL